ncbi:Hypothetical protein CINCED_3A008723 [Cinara cedri]|uniref:C2H2-type domain-containing protein n=1 Tax=Cinara cedri TaxID=506608 RepID=A0A5E4N0I3_9HEMI|nr:Hypothetical protein CINCED_3A008723 [Cinara cedri]
MAYNRRSGGGGYGGYNSGGRYNSGGYRTGSSSNVSPWQSNSGSGGPSPRQSQGGATPALAMASNLISKLLTSSTPMAGSGYNGGPNRSSSWNNGGSRMAHMPMRQRHDGPGGYSKDNRRKGGDSKFSGGNRKSGGAKDGEKRKSGKVNDENKKGPNERERTKEQLDLDKKASYAGVPSAVLYCHVCSKHMWDSESFEKHVRGRPHELMMTYLDEAYRMRVDFMRHQIKAVENQREIDLERVTNNKHKANKANAANKVVGGNANSSKPLLRSYCPMCDVRFYGPLTGHRKSDRHRKLKQFLHPECKLCDALFHTRLEMDEHKLTAGHLKKVAEQRNIENPHLKNDEFDLIDMIKIEEDDQDHDQMPVAKKYEMLTDRDATKLKLELEGGSSEKHREKKNLSAVESDSALASDKTMEVDGEKYEDKEGEQHENKEGEQYEDKEGEQYEDKEDEQYEDKEGEQYEDKNGEEYDEKLDEDNDTSGVVSILEEQTGANKADQSIKDESLITADLTINKDNQAAYDPDVAIGQDLLIPSKGFVCRLCNCFLLDEQRVSIHCQTAAHYINYTTMTKMKEATSGGKKRGIDEVDVDETEVKIEPVDEEEALLQELLNDCGVSQEVENNTEVCLTINLIFFV